MEHKNNYNLPHFIVLIEFFLITDGDTDSPLCATEVK